MSSKLGNTAIMRESLESLGLVAGPTTAGTPPAAPSGALQHASATTLSSSTLLASLQVRRALAGAGSSPALARVGAPALAMALGVRGVTDRLACAEGRWICPAQGNRPSFLSFLQRGPR